MDRVAGREVGNALDKAAISSMEIEAKRDATTLRIMLDLCEEFNIPQDTLLANTGISINSIYQPEALVEMWQEMEAIRNISARHDSLQFAIKAGSKLHVTTLGLLGFAMLSSRDLSDAFHFAEQFHQISLWTCDLAIQANEEEVELFVLAHALPDDCQNFCAVRGLAALKTWLTEMLGREIVPTGVNCLVDAGEGSALFEKYFGIQPKFQAGTNSISFPAHLFHEPLRLADEWTRKSCEAQLIEIKERRRSSFSNRVRDIISLSPRANLLEEDVAKLLKISGSTLRRRLREEGTTFREVRAGTIHSLSRIILMSSSKSVDEVADMLGFSESGCFARSFKRREGIAPGAWRKKERSN
jgi:AraC-like DNA-binding protein